MSSILLSERRKLASKWPLRPLKRLPIKPPNPFRLIRLQTAPTQLRELRKLRVLALTRALEEQGLEVLTRLLLRSPHIALRLLYFALVVADCLDIACLQGFRGGAPYSLRFPGVLLVWWRDGDWCGMLTEDVEGFDLFSAGVFEGEAIAPLAFYCVYVALWVIGVVDSGVDAVLLATEEAFAAEVDLAHVSSGVSDSGPYAILDLHTRWRK